MKFDAVSYELGRLNGNGGGGTANIEAITITENGTTYATSSIDGYAPITVNVATPTPTYGTLNATANGTYTPTAPTDAYNEVIVAVTAPTPTYATLNVTVNGTYTPSAPTDAYNEVVVAVPTPTPTLQNKTALVNGTYTADAGYDGLGEVVVNVSGGQSMYDLTGNIDGLFTSPQATDWFGTNYAYINSISNITSMRWTFSGASAAPNKTIALDTTTGADCTQAFVGAQLSTMPAITGKIIAADEMFKGTSMDIDLSNTTYIQDRNKETDFVNGSKMFTGNNSAEIIMPNTTQMYSYDSMFKDCHNVKHITSPSTVLQAGPSGWGGGHHTKMFNNCYSLREVPAALVAGVAALNDDGFSTGMYYEQFYACYCLDAIDNYPVKSWTDQSPSFFYSLYELNHLSSFTFAANQTANWDGIDLNLQNHIGYGLSVGGYIGYSAKQIRDAATYAALKNDPDAWTMDSDYSRYDHDSAVATINSLPTLESGHTCRVLFDSGSGALTDAGAISTLTSSEIAVATAKGWTVSLS